MSAAEVIEQIKRLPPRERSEVVEFVRHLAEDDDAKDEGTPERTIRHASPTEARAAGDKVVRQYSEVFRKLSE